MVTTFYTIVSVLSLFFLQCCTSNYNLPKRLSERELKSYESFEKVNKTVFKIDTLRLKTKNLFVNGYVYEELNDFVKSLEKKAGIEISE